MINGSIYLQGIIGAVRITGNTSWSGGLFACKHNRILLITQRMLKIKFFFILRMFEVFDSQLKNN